MCIRDSINAEYGGSPSITMQDFGGGMGGQKNRGNARLPPEVNRVLYVRNLPYKIKSDEMYDIFGKYGAIRQIRVGTGPDTRGTAFVVFEDIYDAKNAVDHLSGFNVAGRYLVVLYYQQNKVTKKVDAQQKRADLEVLKEKYHVG
eukprot:TRINITY_DN699_c0_g1_i1.p1 TRINITY_DN699_c0_g1~~TRINITY_DN699_c0_g1_i1.p1  ORF type:complete len:145 (-),score=33.72 TRINITY_DN699_c0_g1_i1:218-652(-)